MPGINQVKDGLLRCMFKDDVPADDQLKLAQAYEHLCRAQDDEANTEQTRVFIAMNRRELDAPTQKQEPNAEIE